MSVWQTSCTASCGRKGGAKWGGGEEHSRVGNNNIKYLKFQCAVGPVFGKINRSIGWKNLIYEPTVFDKWSLMPWKRTIVSPAMANVQENRWQTHRKLYSNDGNPNSPLTHNTPVPLNNVSESANWPHVERKRPEKHTQHKWGELQCF